MSSKRAKTSANTKTVIVKTHASLEPLREAWRSVNPNQPCPSDAKLIEWAKRNIQASHNALNTTRGTLAALGKQLQVKTD
jgi:hypothetical protein